MSAVHKLILGIMVGIVVMALTAAGLIIAVAGISMAQL